MLHQTDKQVHKAFICINNNNLQTQNYVHAGAQKLTYGNKRVGEKFGGRKSEFEYISVFIFNNLLLIKKESKELRKVTKIINVLLYIFCAAFTIILVTSSGCESIDTWLAFR